MKKSLYKRGSILIVLLWVLTFLFFVGVEIQLLVQRTKELVRFEKNQLIAKVASLSGVEYSKYLLLSDKEPLDTLHEKWSNQEIVEYKLSKDISFTLNNKNKSTNYKFSFGLKDLESKISLVSLPIDRWSSILNLNESQQKTLESFREGVRKFEDLLQLSSILNLSNKQMMGEDQNDDGLLNENENDGDFSLPKDNFDNILNFGISDLVSWQAKEMNVNTIGAYQLKKLYPQKKDEIDQFIIARSQKTSGYSTIPSNFQTIFQPKKWFGVHSNFFITRSKGQVKSHVYRSKFLLYRDDKKVYILRPLVW
ncbi:MAG: hypothetical protein COB02_03640 [Candidatus Cloacimonadota bacterium]|nr:MAG: hypothetical protein COB02_03640 [Candidatus Cloacimonadota bacterium]